ncbi:MAG: hypothetical protein GY865_06965, partial [candidate division Zixibacteria bacterium]|nr:hypothetical protein [candidate division Zixibacteria bacterium]
MYNNKLICLLLFLMTCFLILSCGENNDQTLVPVFNGQRAYEYIEEQVSYGPRVPGSVNAINCRKYFLNFFDSLGIDVDTMQFIHNSKVSGKPITMINIIASIDPDDKNITERYLMAAHYDSRPRAEYDADPLKREDWIDGAN